MWKAFLRRSSGSGVWAVAPDSELPRLSQTHAPVTNSFLLLAGGLALILSRTEGTLREPFPHARLLYQRMRAQLAEQGTTTVSAGLLLEAFHEVNHLLDPTTREAMKRCMEARQAARASAG